MVGNLIERIWLHLCIWLLRLTIRAPKIQPARVIQIPSRHSKRTIRANVYSPATHLTGKPAPVLINFHGSAFVLPLHGSDEEFCKQMVAEAGLTVLDIKYALGPERPWPACHEDAEDVINWVRSQPAQYETDRISVSGFSSGGNIAAIASAVTLPDVVKQLVLFYPVTDLSVARHLKEAPEPRVSKPPPAWITRLFRAAYIQDDKLALKSPKVSPSYAEYTAFPDRVLMITAGGDSLCLEAEALAARIKEVEGKEVWMWRAGGCGHAWDQNVLSGSPQELAKKNAYALAARFLSGQSLAD